MKERILDINPKAEVEVYKCFYLPENADDFDFSKYSYVVDAVDTVTAKIEIIMRAKACNVPVISCMGAGNKLDPTKFRVADIYKTNMCPLAKVMRREMKKRGEKKLSSRSCKKVYGEAGHPWQRSLCAICSRPDSGRRGYQGSFRSQGETAVTVGKRIEKGRAPEKSNCFFGGSFCMLCMEICGLKKITSLQQHHTPCSLR